MAVLLASLPISKSIKSDLLSNITNCHSGQWKQSRRITNLSNKHVNAMVTPVRGYQMSVHYSMGGSSSKVSNPKLDGLQVGGVNNEPLQSSSIEHSFSYVNTPLIHLPPYQEHTRLWFLFPWHCYHEIIRSERSTQRSRDKDSMSCHIQQSHGLIHIP